MKRLKVFGGYLFNRGKQIRTIVATYTQKRAMELLGISQGEFRNYWRETYNDVELDIAKKYPGTVFWASSDMGYDFVEKGME